MSTTLPKLLLPLGGFGGPAVVFFAEQQDLNWPWYIVWPIGIAGAICLFIWFALLIYWAWQSLPSAPRQLGLTEAGRLIYAKASPRLKSLISGMAEQGTASIEGWGRSAMITAAKKNLCTIYGRRGEGLPHEIVPASDLGWLWPDAKNQLSGLNAAKPTYIDVAVKRSETLLVLKEFERDNYGQNQG